MNKEDIEILYGMIESNNIINDAEVKVYEKLGLILESIKCQDKLDAINKQIHDLDSKENEKIEEI